MSTEFNNEGSWHCSSVPHHHHACKSELCTLGIGETAGFVVNALRPIHVVCVYACTCVVCECVTMPIVQYPIDSNTVNCFSPPSTILSANEQGVPSESYLQEVREQLEERREEPEENQHQRETRSVSDDAG